MKEKKTRPSSKSRASQTKKEIVEELQRLNDQMEDLQLLLRKLSKKHKNKKLVGGFVGGIANAAGLLVGTLILSAILLYAGQAVVRSQGFQDWAKSTVKQAVSETVSEEVQKLPF